MNDFVRDETSEQFTMIPHWIFDSNLTAMERLAWIVIKTFAWGQRDSAFPSVATIANMMGVSSKRTVHSAIDGCIEKGFLSKEVRFDNDRYQTNIYTLKRPQIEGGSAKYALGVVQNMHGGSAYSAPETNNINIKEIKQTKEERSKDVCLSRSTSEEIVPQDQEALLLEEREKGQETATVIDTNTDIYAPAVRALATEFGHFATYEEQRLLERHIDERGLPAVLDAICACKQINAHPHAPAKYVIGYLNNTPHVTSEMTEHVKAYSSPKTNNIPDYKPTQSEYADLKEIAKHASPNELARFIRNCKEEPFWQLKIVGTPYIRRNIGTWKAQQ